MCLYGSSNDRSMGGQTIIPRDDAPRGSRKPLDPLAKRSTARDLRAVPDLNVAAVERLRRQVGSGVARIRGEYHEEGACLIRGITGSLAHINDLKHAPDAFPSRYAAVGDDAADPRLI